MGRDSRSRSRGGGADEAKIQDMVDERQQCRRDRDFDKADRIRDELRDMGVRVDDTELTWEGRGGMRGRIDNGKGGGKGGGGGRGRDRGGDVDPEMEEKLDAWVAAKRQRDFETADRIRAELKDMGLNNPEELRPPPGKGKNKGGGGGGGRRDSRDRGRGGGGGRRDSRDRGGGRGRRDSRDRGRGRDDSRGRGRR
eukprot:gnl/MRDRNA2_/MRDRNA2_29370_c0_seq2.p2 gnl/MRDRNA2_/MRDRNA2_29370_c0~~gnl/MRDRNA2_/MRDRNA2_29370_c0_seq2.p2  ORF type:complete len:196 (+),score=54.19 gnl/MRDRNA2_/MRDRNA2_29370_c0_seq2:102-689(+)